MEDLSIRFHEPWRPSESTQLTALTTLALLQERLAAHRVPPPPVEAVWQEQLEEVVHVVEGLKCSCTDRCCQEVN